MIHRLFASPAALLTLTSVMWASNAIVGQLAVGQVAPFALVFMRWALVAAAMWAFYRRQLRAHWPAIRPRLGLLTAMAAAGFTGFNAMFYVASTHTTGLNIGILQGAMPVMVMAGAWLAFRDRVTGLQALGVAITLAGVLIVATGADFTVLRDFAFNRGDVMLLAAGLLYSFYAVALRNRPAVPGTALFTLFAMIACVAALPLAVWEAAQPGYAWPTPRGFALTLWVAVFPSSLAQIFFLRGVDLVGPGRAGVYVNLVPVFTAILAVAMLGERFAPYHGAALVLVIGGIWLAQRSARRSL